MSFKSQSFLRYIFVEVDSKIDSRTRKNRLEKLFLKIILQEEKFFYPAKQHVHLALNDSKVNIKSN